MPVADTAAAMPVADTAAAMPVADTAALAKIGVNMPLTATTQLAGRRQWHPHSRPRNPAT
jgi:hypothetical protein